MMKTFIAGMLVMVLVVAKADANSKKNSSDPCSNVFCDRGRVCVVEDDISTVCVCPDDCGKEYDPVCSFYNRSFNNTCEMHKFACHYGFFTGVNYKGLCVEQDSESDGCPIERLLDFHDRYLAWILIAYNEDHNVEIKQKINLDDMADEERRKLIEYEFTSRDINKNGNLDPNEMKVMVDDREPCMVALFKGCDYDGEPGISHNEWNSCIPLQLEVTESEKEHL